MQEPALTNAVQAKDFQQSVNLVVGGIYYSLSVADIARYPESYFAHLVQPHWTKDSTAVMKIDRNGEIFRYISSFIFYGQFEPPHRPIQDLETLLSVREEADFYNLPDLIHKCDSGITEWIKEWCRQQLSHAGVFSLYGCVQDTREKSTDALLNAVHLIRPPCIATAMTTTLSEVAIPIPTWSRTYYENIPGSAHYNCIQPIGDFVEYSHLINICEPFAVCPFTGNKLKPRPADCRRLDVEVLLLYYSYFEGGYCTKRTPVTVPEIVDVSYDYLFENSRTKAERMVRGEDQHCASAAIDKPRVLRQAFSVCPLSGYDLQPYPAPTHIDNFVDIYAYRTGESCSKRPQYYWSGLKVGTILCILKSEHTGGRITAQVNGQTFSIEKPGECLALQLGISYAVEAVTSGLLEVVEYAMYHYEWREKKEPLLPWVTNVSTALTHDMICCGILTALGSEFERYKGVVLCLTDFYPIVPSCNETRRFETAEQALTELERQLLSHLAQHYIVEIVTVSVSFSSEYTVVGACVLDYLPTVGHYESIQNITATVAKEEEEISSSVNYKVMVPRYGYGEKFPYEWDCPRYNYKGTLLSGFMITQKEKF
eukprot:gene8941-10560_t